MKDTMKYAITGALAGTANGFFGSGGGLFLVPMFTKWLKMDQRKAFATSVAVILPLSVVALIVYIFKGSIDFMASLPYLLGGLAGVLTAVGSSFLAAMMDVSLLRRCFGVFLLYIGVKELFCKKENRDASSSVKDRSNS